MPRTVGVMINARLASSRVPQKLIRPFGKSTLLDIALKKISCIKNSNEKYLAAGDDAIINIYNNYSNIIDLLKRDKKAISQGEHDQKISFAHFCDIESDYVMIINPCLPFTKVSTYEKAISFFKKHEELITLTSIIEFKDIFFDNENKIIYLKDSSNISTVTANLLYKMAHVFHFVEKKRFCETGVIFGYQENDPGFFPVSKYECFDIDEEDDFEFCKKIYKYLKDDN